MILNRPEALDAIARENLTQYGEAMIKFRDEPDAWAVIITRAAENAFSAGADLKDVVPAVRNIVFQASQTIVCGVHHYKPVIAALSGIAFDGGLEILLTSDIIHISTELLFIYEPVKYKHEIADKRAYYNIEGKTPKMPAVSLELFGHPSCLSGRQELYDAYKQIQERAEPLSGEIKGARSGLDHYQGASMKTHLWCHNQRCPLIDFGV